MKFLVTGSAGFVGSALSLRLLKRGDTVIGIDNHNSYYDPTLKEARLERHAQHPNYTHLRIDLADREAVRSAFRTHKPHCVVNLAAQAGVRYSIENPMAYIDSNIVGFGNILEGCRHNAVQHLVYASSSSVYGMNTVLPFSEHQNVDHPISLYAASKKSNELMAHTYSHLFNLPTTGLRFFTVYGPWGRPDMALFLFTKAILAGESIDIFNHGKMVRDFTFIEDVVEGIIRVADKPATPSPIFDAARPDPSSSSAPYRVFNVGNNQPTPLMDYIHALEEALDRKAQKNYLPMQPGDVFATAANTDQLNAWIDFRPNTSVKEGVKRFVDWYQNYYKV